MACNCVEYQCLEVDYDMCSNGVELPLVADETGTWVLLIEFNNTWIRLNIEVTDGEPIVIQNILNEYYTHTIRLLTTAKDLFNDTCYRLVTQNVSASMIPAPSGSLSPARETYRLDFTVGDNPATFTQLIGVNVELLGVYVEGLDIPSEITNTSTGEVTFNGSVGAGQTGYILYKK